MTQLERVETYIRNRGRVTTWELEDWAVHLDPMIKISAGNVTRHARTLYLDYKLIKHPIIDGKKNLHEWVWVGG